MMSQSIHADSSSPRFSARLAKTVEILNLAHELGVDQPFSSSQSQGTTTTPPLDEVTIYSSTETDDSSTCSSVSSEEGDSSSFVVSTPTSPRSIFQPYWEKHSRESVCDRVPSPPLCDSSERSGQSTNTYERTIKMSERPNRRRRRIFSDLGCAAPQQEVPEEMQTLVSTLRMRVVPRKTKSAPVLGTAKPSASCLRSGNRRRRSDSSVSFSSKVDVVYFERPKEIWASGGWSKFFSS